MGHNGAAKYGICKAVPRIQWTGPGALTRLRAEFQRNKAARGRCCGTGWRGGGKMQSAGIQARRGRAIRATILGRALFAGAGAAMLGFLAGAAEAAVFFPSGSHDARPIVDSPGSEVSGPLVTKSGFTGLSFTISNRISSFGRGQNGGGGQQTTFRGEDGTGLSAGEGTLRNGVWTNISLTGTADTSTLTTDGKTITGIAGYDRLVWNDRLLVGVGLIADGAKFATNYNAGDIKTRSIGFVPYAAWRVTDQLTLSAIANYSHGWAETTRLTGAGNTATGEYETDRWFVQGGADYEIFRGNWAFVARTELSYGQEVSSSYAERGGADVGSATNVVGTWRIGGQVGYTFTLDAAGGGFAEPYFLAGYELDFNRTRIRNPSGVPPHANDNDQFNLGGGINLYAGDNWSANVEGAAGVGRTDVDIWTLSATLRYQF